MNLIITRINKDTFSKHTTSGYSSLNDNLAHHILSKIIDEYNLLHGAIDLMTILKRDGVYCYTEHNRQLVIALDLIN